MGEKSKMRSATKAVAGAVPFVSDETRQSIDEGMARLILGLQSQVYGLDEKGKPNGAAWLTGGEGRLTRLKRMAGEKGLPEPDEYSMPGVLNEVLSLPTLLPGLAEFGAAVLPGVDSLTPEQTKWLEDHLVPERSKRAEARQTKLKALLRKSAELDEPKGFKENALESLGAMFGQLPLPGAGVKKVTEGVGKSVLKDIAGAVPEYVLPTIKPSVRNYGAGAVAGGALGALASSAEEEPKTGYAEGGKVGILAQALERLSQIIQGAKAKTDDVDELMFALRKVEVGDPAKRRELSRLQSLRGVAQLKADPVREDVFNQRLLDNLAEIYLNPQVKEMKRRGGRVGAFYDAMKELEGGLKAISPSTQTNR
jgi:hypothetical protein